MQKVFIVNPPDKDLVELHITKDMAGGFGFNAGSGVSLPSLELIYHAITLKNYGYDINFYDLQAEADKLNIFLEKIKKSEKPIFLILVTAPTLKNDLVFIGKIKELSPDSLVYVHLGLKNEEMIKSILQTGLVKKVLFGETGNIIVDIFEKNLNDGCAYLSGEEVVYGSGLIINDLNDLPDLNLDFLDVSKYNYILLPSTANTFTFQSSRGCPFPCAYYCPYPLIQGRTWRAMSAEKLYRNIEILVNKYQVKSILFRDATFTLDKERAAIFCDQVLRNNLQFSWWCETRMNCLDEELIKKMSQAGCRGINLGVETGDDELMKTQGKIGGDLKQLINIKNLTDKYNIKLHFLMIVGLPDETKQSIYKSYQLIDGLEPSSLGVTTITPYPGTPLYLEAKNNGWIIDENMDHYTGNQVVMRTKYLSPRQIKRGNFMLQLAGYLSRQKSFIYYPIRKMFKIYFWLWSRV